jgi:CheY-like chemotaxis protein
MSIAYAARRPVVLIVEDDLLIRLHATQIIAGAEFDVIEASNADEAISLLEARSDITVLFTDIQMPGSMDGLELAAAVKWRWPPIKVVATSGLVNVRLEDLPEGGRFIPKPYNPYQLTQTLQEVTAGY